jgi:CspA family cold shock protein
MATGTVRWFSDDDGHGFMAPDEGGEELFVHHNDLAGDGHYSLKEGIKVSLDTRTEDRGPRTINVAPLWP